HNLRSAGVSLLFFFVLHQVGTSHRLSCSGAIRLQFLVGPRALCSCARRPAVDNTRRRSMRIMCRAHESVKLPAKMVFPMWYCSAGTAFVTEIVGWERQGRAYYFSFRQGLD